MADIRLDIKSELPKAIRWTDQMTKQLPFAISQALNATAYGVNTIPGSKASNVRTALNNSTRQYLDRPTRFTQTAFFYKPSNKRHLVAEVFPSSKPGMNRARYLQYAIEGGTRVQKGFERRLLAEVAKTGRMPPRAQLIPSSHIKTDRHGNVTRSTIGRILKGLDDKGSRNRGYFFGEPRGDRHRAIGIYRRSKHQVFPYFFVTTQQSYRARFPINRVADTVIQRRFGTYLRSSLERAVATAR
jgi:hypothetical protein